MSQVLTKASFNEFHGVDALLGSGATIVYESIFSLRHSGRILDLLLFAAKDYTASCQNPEAVEVKLRECLELLVLGMWANYRPQEKTKSIELEIGWDQEKICISVSAFLSDAVTQSPESNSFSPYLAAIEDKANQIIIRHLETIGFVQTYVTLFKDEKTEKLPSSWVSVNSTPAQNESEIPQIKNLPKSPAGKKQRLARFQQEEAAEDQARDKAKQRKLTQKPGPVVQKAKEAIAQLRGETIAEHLEEITVPDTLTNADSEDSVEISNSKNDDAALEVISVIEGSEEADDGSIKAVKRKSNQSQPRTTGPLTDEDLSSSIEEETNLDETIIDGSNTEDSDESLIVSGTADLEEDNGIIKVTGRQKKPAKTIKKVVKKQVGTKKVATKGTDVETEILIDEPVFEEVEEIVEIEGSAESEDEQETLVADTGLSEEDLQTLVAGSGDATSDDFETLVKDTKTTDTNSVKTHVKGQKKSVDSSIQKVAGNADAIDDSITKLSGTDTISDDQKIQVKGSSHEVPDDETLLKIAGEQLGLNTSEESINDQQAQQILSGLDTNLKETEKSTAELDSAIGRSGAEFTRTVSKYQQFVEKMPMPEKVKSYLQGMFEELSKNRTELEDKVKEINSRWRKAQMEFKSVQISMEKEITQRDIQLRQKAVGLEKAKQMLASTMKNLETFKADSKNTIAIEMAQREQRMKLMMEKARDQIAKAQLRSEDLQKKLSAESMQRSNLANEHAKLTRNLDDANRKISDIEKSRLANKEDPALKAEVERTGKQVEELKKQNKLLSEKLTQAQAVKSGTDKNTTTKNGKDPEVSDTELKHKLDQSQKLYAKMKEDFDKNLKRLDEAKQGETKLKVEISKLQAEIQKLQKAAKKAA